MSIAILVFAAVAGFVYLRHERQGLHGIGLAALRVVGLTALVLLFVNPVRTSRVTGGTPTVLLDASLSMQAAGGRWAAALDSARALGGTILRFGATVSPFDTMPPEGGVTMLRDALAAARARGGPTVVVTDGEIEDAGSLPPALTPGTRFVVLPRDTVPGAALLSVDLPARVQRDDSLIISFTVGTWGALAADSARLVVATGERQLARQTVALPPPAGTARRRAALPPGLLSAGTHVVRVRLDVDGDVERRDDERLLLVEVSELPAIVVIVDPPDWEGRFLVAELSDVSRTTVRGYARTGRATWLDMRTMGRVSQDQVATAARGAGLLVIRGRRDVFAAARRGPLWLWSAADPRLELVAGDWYLTSDLPVSPLAARLAGLAWDSLAPLTGIVRLAPREGDWVALTARQGRRGAERPVLIGRDSVGMRVLITGGEGLWRWRFRGGAVREAYRAILAAGIDWLLVERGGRPSGPLTAGGVVQRGMPAVFRWTRDSIPDSLAVTFASDTGTVTHTLQFGADRNASVWLDPGVYRWVAPDADNLRGVVVVEAYSDEFAPRMVMPMSGSTAEAFTLVERHARGRWWLFVVALLALAGEWGWRQRRGLP